MSTATFADLGLAPSFLQALEELTFTTPTPVQEQVIPLALAGQDIAGQAPTGSGKTAAYGLSILQQLDVKQDAVQVIVLVPARELALQVRDALKKLGKYLPNLRVAAFYGGHAFRSTDYNAAYDAAVYACEEYHDAPECVVSCQREQ